MFVSAAAKAAAIAMCTFARALESLMGLLCLWPLSPRPPLLGFGVTGFSLVEQVPLDDMEALRQLPGRTGIFKRSDVPKESASFSVFDVRSWYALIRGPSRTQTSSSLQIRASSQESLALAEPLLALAGDVHPLSLRALGPGADEGLAWMGAQLTTEVVAPA